MGLGERPLSQPLYQLSGLVSNASLASINQLSIMQQRAHTQEDSTLCGIAALEMNEGRQQKLSHLRQRPNPAQSAQSAVIFHLDYQIFYFLCV